MNVQDTILKGIQDLLYRENFLVLPGFGGFVLKPQSAGYNATSTVLFPASKRPGFNRQLKQNDGVLQNWLQKELYCDAAEALKHLEEFAGYCNSLLGTRRRLNMKGLGFFYLDFENNLCFEADSDVNFQAESFGLSPVKLLPVLDPIREIKNNDKLFADRKATESLRTEKPVKTSWRPLRKTIVVSSVIILVFSALAALISLNGVSGRLYASILHTDMAAAYSPISYSAQNLTDKTGNNTIRLEQGRSVLFLELEPGFVLKVENTSPPATTGDLSSVNDPNTNKDFFTVVLGSFSIPKNAINFAKQVSAQHPEGEVLNLPQHKHRMVSLGRYRDKEEARHALQQLATEYPGAWVLKR